MNLEEINQMNQRMENEEKIRKSVRDQANLSNIEKLIFFKFISEKRAQELNDIFIKKYYIEDWESQINQLEDVYVDVDKIVGTHHSSYNDQNLFQAVNKLKKSIHSIQWRLINPNYFHCNTSRDISEKKLSLAYKQHEDEYYICGDGNNRFLISKALGGKILVNKVYVYNENTVMKQRLNKLLSFGFTYKIAEEQISIESNHVKLRIDGFENELEQFLGHYENIKISSWDEKIFILKSIFISNYRNKYAYSVDKVRHLVHFNYQRLRKHKRESTNL